MHRAGLFDAGLEGTESLQRRGAEISPLKSGGIRVVFQEAAEVDEPASSVSLAPGLSRFVGIKIDDTDPLLVAS